MFAAADLDEHLSASKQSLCSEILQTGPLRLFSGRIHVASFYMLLCLGIDEAAGEDSTSSVTVSLIVNIMSGLLITTALTCTHTETQSRQ